MTIPYIVEVRDTSGDLISILENASSINYTQKVNAAHTLSFLLPSDDSKLADVTLADELWLRNYDTDTVIKKFRLQKKWDIRDGDKITTRVEAMDYMSQLATSMVMDYDVGVNLIYRSATVGYGGTISAIVEDDTHIYVGGGTTERVRRYLKSTMAYVDQTVGYGGYISHIAVDDTHIYVGGQTTDKVSRYLKSTMAYVDQTADYGGGIYTLAVDDTHLYVGGAVTEKVNKYLKSTMAYVSQTAAYGGNPYSIAVDDTHIYVGGQTTDKVNRYLKATMAYVDQTADYGGIIRGITIDNTYLYAGGSTTEKVSQYLKTTLAYVDQTPAYGGTIHVVKLSADGIYLYAGGATTNKVRRYLTSDMTLVDEGTDYGGIIYDMALDDDSVFIGGATTETVFKYSTFDTIDEIIDDLLAYTMQTPAITKGTIAPTYVNLVRNIRTGSSSILGVLLSLQAMVGGYIEVDNNRLLQWSVTIGEDKGQQIRYGKNLIDIEREVDYNQLFNRIYAYGYNAATGKRIELSTIQTNDYVEDATSQATWGGIYIGSFINFSIASSATLLEWANELLADHSAPVISYRINSIDLSAHDGFDFDALQLGSTVTVIDEDLGIDVSAIVVWIEHPKLELDPSIMMIELANVTRNVADTLTQLNGIQKQHDYLLAAA